MSEIEAEAIPAITLGWRLRMALERADITVNEMAATLRVHRGTLGRWTHDQGAPPREMYLERWAELCAVPYAWLVGDLYEDPTDETRTVPHPRRRSSDIEHDTPGSSDQYEYAALACRDHGVVGSLLVDA